MLRFIGLMVLLTIAFGLGYVSGQLPPPPILGTIHQLTKGVLGKTLGIGSDLRRRQALLDAKSHLLEAKLHLTEHNFGSAGRELGDAAESLNHALQGSSDSTESGRLRELAGRIREIRMELTSGRNIPPAKINSVQRHLDALLSN